MPSFAPKQSVRHGSAGAELNSEFRIGRKAAKARWETPMPPFAPKQSVRMEARAGIAKPHQT